MDGSYKDAVREERLPSIYGLFDGGGNLRYIGKAIDPAKRISGHMRERRRKAPLYDWIAKNGRPEIRILEKCCRDWREAERRLIAEARARGDRLLNLADGGDEPFCPSRTRSKNGKRLAAVLHRGSGLGEMWKLKRDLNWHSRSFGIQSDALRAKMHELARLVPDIFGEWESVR